MNKLRARKDMHIPSVPKLMGSAGEGSFDFMFSGFDFLENGTTEQIRNWILNSKMKLFGYEPEDWATVFRANREQFHWVQADYLERSLSGRDVRPDVGPQTKEASTSPTWEHTYKYRAGEFPTFPQGIIDVMQEGYPFHAYPFTGYTSRVEPTLKEYTQDVAITNMLSGIQETSVGPFSQWVDKTESFPTVNVEKFSQFGKTYGTTVMPDGKILAVYSVDGSQLKMVKIDPVTGEADPNFFIKNSQGVAVLDYINGVQFDMIKIFVANDSIFLWFSGQMGYFTLNDGENNLIGPYKLYKMGMDGTIDDSFNFPGGDGSNGSVMNCNDLLNILYRNNKYVFVYNNLYYYENLFANGDKNVGVIQVDLDGTNPVILFENDLLDNVFEYQINETRSIAKGIVKFSKVMSNGDIMLVTVNNEAETTIYRILNDNSVDPFSFNQDPESGVLTRRWNFYSNDYNNAIRGIEELSDDGILLYGNFNRIVVLPGPDEIHLNIAGIIKLESINNPNIVPGFADLQSKTRDFTDFQSSKIGFGRNTGADVYSVKEIDGKLYVICYATQYSDNFINNAATKCIRLTLNGEYDDTMNLAFYQVYNAKLEYLNGKIYILPSTNEDSVVSYINNVSYLGLISPQSVEAISKIRQGFDWVDDFSNTQQVSFLSSGIIEIDSINQVTFTRSIVNPIVEGLLSDYQVTDANAYNSNFLGKGGVVENPSELRDKFFLGEQLSVDEELDIQKIKESIIRKYSRPEYYPDLTDVKLEPDEAIGFPGYSPFISPFMAGFTESLSEVIQSEKFTLESYVDAAYKFEHIQGEPGEVRLLEEDGNFYVWNALAGSWIIDDSTGFYGNYRSWCYVNRNNKIKGLIGIALSTPPATWAGYHIIKTNLDEYLNSL